MAALQSQGGAGPTGVDSQVWKRLCTSFRSASTELYNSVAMVARRICTSTLDPAGLAPLTASQLVALDKCPGVRPIGIEEIIRHIIAKAILQILALDIKEVAGSFQLCAGQEAGCEAAVHAMRKIFQRECTEAILQVDATNAFNRLNRQATLRNIQVLCPSCTCYCVNQHVQKQH